MAVLGYVLGRQRPRATLRTHGDRQEIARALAVAQDLETILRRLQKALAVHQPQVMKFNSRLQRLEQKGAIGWQHLGDRADEMLKPTLRLGSEISHAYAELLQQMTHLATFAELRTDPLTGVNNRRAFDESLSSLLAQRNRYSAPLSLAMLDIDLFKQINDERGHLDGDRVLQDLAQHLRTNIRECDVLARYGGEEFIVLMPNTELPAACNLTERIRATVAANLSITVSIGVAAAIGDENGSELLARADAALYKAKEAGRNCVYLHEGASGRMVGIKSAQRLLTPQVDLSHPPAIVAEAVTLPDQPQILPWHQLAR
ncbi:MAG: GGDEF domain-containing protein [Planctomycetia bacterium]|nr:GGDEF domain-containing protein [Planctomycetia bacterium]